MNTLNPVISKTVAAQEAMFAILNKSKDITELQSAAYEFEDTINGLSGSILGLETSVIDGIRITNAEIVSHGTLAGITITLHESMLPVTVQTSTILVTELGKKLYPLTTSVTVEKTIVVSESSANVVTDTTESNYISNLSETSTVDALFDELDAEALAEDTESLAEVQEEPRKMLPEFMVEAALACAANTSGVEAGLVEFSVNPLSDLIQNTMNLVLSYTANNYAGLNAALSSVSSNGSLASQYASFQYALGGGDGLAGSVAQLDAFFSHTNRLSGLTLDSDSPFAGPTGDSTEEEVLFLANTANVTYTILSFNAKQFRSAKYFVQATCVREHQLSELYIIHDNVLPYVREVGTTYTQDPYVDFSASLVNGVLSVLAKSQVANTSYLISGKRLKIAKTGLAHTEMSQGRILENAQLLTAYLADGVDYVAYQSASLFKANLIAELARELRDMIAWMSSSTFDGLSLSDKQNTLLSYAETLNMRNAAIQIAIETDYTAYETVKKQLTALSVAFDITSNYANANARPVLTATLNNTINTGLASLP